MPMPLLLLTLHAVLGGVVLASSRRLGRWGFALGGLAPAATFAWLIARAPGILDGDPVLVEQPWVETLGLSLDLRIDGFGLLMGGIVSGIGVLIFLYGWHYLSGSDSAGRIAGLLTLFAGAMTVVVLADNVFLLFVGWELTSIVSYLLVGGDGRTGPARDAARRALLTTGAGGLALLGGLVVLAHEAGTVRLSELLDHPPASSTPVMIALLLVLVGVMTKSAQFPFHRWLPGAMVAPTPISAYLHSATMVKAGVYLVARFGPAFADHGAFRWTIVVVGLVTMILGGWTAMQPTDLKQILAFGTISQLGFLVVLFGAGFPEATAAGVGVILAHALFKATLFLIAGIVDHGAGTRDLRLIPELHGPAWTTAKVVAAVAAASMAAVPPLAGFVAKEAAYSAFLHGSTSDKAVFAGLFLGSILTVAYSLRIAVGLFRPGLVADRTEEPGYQDHAPAHVHAPSFGFLSPALVLTVGTVGLGLATGFWEEFAGPAAEALDHDAHIHLVLWPGLGSPLLFSMLTLLAGAGAFALRRPIGRLVGRTTPVDGTADVFGALVGGLPAFGTRVASLVQRGSLAFSAGLAMTFVAVVTSVVLLTNGDWWSGGIAVVGEVADLPIAAILVIAGVACTVVTRRYTAAILLGVVGYGMALFFVVSGAPDLALTQVAVETLSVVVFLVVLRYLPQRFEERPPMASHLVRIGASVLVGGFVLLFSLATAGIDQDPTVAHQLSERALPEGHGANVVNVILVDIRGIDTVGEVTVLVGAALGIAALARAVRRGSASARGPAKAVDA